MSSLCLSMRLLAYICIALAGLVVLPWWVGVRECGMSLQVHCSLMAVPATVLTLFLHSYHSGHEPLESLTYGRLNSW